MPSSSDIPATDPVDVSDTSPAGTDADASSSRVGPPAGEPDALPGTDTMDAETGGLAGTSR